MVSPGYFETMAFVSWQAKLLPQRFDASQNVAIVSEIPSLCSGSPMAPISGAFLGVPDSCFFQKRKAYGLAPWRTRRAKDSLTMATFCEAIKSLGKKFRPARRRMPWSRNSLG